ncbi:MAG: DUF4159 domain-containing protein [Planctomycetes bacterium]|nr:DUF4159 domain-containing protein [Planctomycetota bacterium]
MSSMAARLVLIGLLVIATTGRSARADIDAERVRKAIELGTTKLLAMQDQRSGTWQEHPGLPGGVTALCTLSLITAGVSVHDPQVQKSLTLLRSLRPRMTYTCSLQTLVLCAAEPQKDLLRIRENVQWLESQQIRENEKKGAWGYGNSQGTGDNSNTQFAMLALHEARRVGVPVSKQTWKLALAYWLRTQNLDGSWGYMEGAPGTGSMTCAGIAAVVIASEELAETSAEVHGDQIRCCGDAPDDTPVQRALQWLGSHFKVETNPGMARNWLLYYLYGVERVGRLTNQRFLGGHDWYREGANMLVEMQDRKGGLWVGPGTGEDSPSVATPLALLFLSKGRRPVLISKLKHEPSKDWNHHPNDLGNLTEYAETRWKRDMTWQVIDWPRASSDDLLQSPVVWLSGRDKLQLTDAQVASLRDYVDRGGFLFAEQCCGGKDFDQSFRALVKRMFPEVEHELRLLPPEHPIWTAEERVDSNYLKPLWGIDVGCRTAVAYCPEDLGCYWEVASPMRDEWLRGRPRAQVEAARSLGLNVLAYATNRELRGKLDEIAPPLASHDRDKVERAKIWVGKVRHAGGWNVAPAALPNLMNIVQREAGLRVRLDAEDLSLDDPALFQHHMLFMHGRHSFKFSEAERAKLRTYVARGGCILADSICSSPEFTNAMRQEMAAVFPDHPLERIPPAHPMFTKKYGGFDVRTVSLREAQPAAGGGPRKLITRDGPPDLEGIKIDGHYGVIFSPHDLSCSLERHESIECAGYARKDAAQIGLNVVMYSLYE